MADAAPPLPNFFIVGAPKAGTTSLYAWLARHPEVAMSRKKEPFFFGKPVESLDWAWYRDLFQHVTTEKAIGEASTRYSTAAINPNIAAGIATCCPDAKLILMARHPLDRIESMWLQTQGAGFEKCRFDKAVRTKPDYVEASRYRAIVNKFLEYFTRDQLLILFFEDLQQDGAAVFRQVLEFLEVDPTLSLENEMPTYNRALDKQIDNPVGRLFRNLPGSGSIRDALPTSIRTGMRQILKRPVKAKPKWKRSTLEWVVQELESDTAAFLQYAGRDPSQWQFDIEPRLEPGQ
jgi:hypothetical protein